MINERRQLEQARAMFVEACSDALRGAERKHPLLAAQMIWAIPSDLAAHGFEVSMMQNDANEWWIEASREIGEGVFTVQAKGNSMLEALQTLSRSAATVFESWQFGEIVEPVEAA